MGISIRRPLQDRQKPGLPEFVLGFGILVLGSRRSAKADRHRARGNEGKADRLDHQARELAIFGLERTVHGTSLKGHVHKLSSPEQA